MARTTQKARKSTGGTAPRKNGVAVHLPVAISNLPVAEKQHRQEYCYICVNGGDLWLCDRCTRVVCSKHIPLPQGTDLRNSVFLCVACHLRVFSKPVPYFGFYRGDFSLLVKPADSWKPILRSPLLIGGDYQLTANSQVLADPLLVLHFVLVSISPKGNPARMISEMLGGFLLEESFAYREITFDLATDELALQYTDAITVLVQALEGRGFNRVVVVITNHSHDDTGDLYIGDNLCTTVDDFMKALFPPVLVSFLRPKSTTMFMLCCGALIRERESFIHLQDAIHYMSINYLVAFTAIEFHAALITPFFIDFTHRVLLEGFDLVSSMKYMLIATVQSPVARHTNIVLMYKTGESSITSTLYVFTHPRWRPWGQRLPPACPKCCSPHSWSDEIKKNSTYSFVCRYEGCTGSCSFQKPDGFDLYTPDINGGRWMKKVYQF